MREIVDLVWKIKQLQFFQNVFRRELRSSKSKKKIYRGDIVQKQGRKMTCKRWENGKFFDELSYPHHLNFHFLSCFMRARASDSDSNKIRGRLHFQLQDWERFIFKFRFKQIDNLCKISRSFVQAWLVIMLNDQVAGVEGE